ncbi:hypothetical protein DVA67_006815 [Solirubrobacter sp. CPCC 204708]|uniref:Tetratricopeptide repeat protein n=1 Tax=Solirubrobacter deserti TaxID=2282478 RepID=A0ABT4RT35_9ACTN|nr:hypothetical protein [Solirubrobacter deserti]MBE2315679.1 hypothetical protein [Solirubrobacter deserti]MDA0141743.1 hypothetical protein [Solirubrobacter deserti]
MSARLSVRAARVELALALADQEGRLDDAIAELGRALEDPGEDTLRWQVHWHLALLSARANRRPDAAFGQAFAAALAAPPDEAEEPAEFALDLLRGGSVRRAVTQIDDATIDRLVERALTLDGGSVLLMLAGHILMLRGDAHKAGRLFDAAPDTGGTADAARAVADALTAIDDGGFDAALDALAGLDDDVPGVAAARALALYGGGRLEEALACTRREGGMIDTAMAETVIWLRVAVAHDQATDALTQAERSASVAARLDPSQPEALLLRAQVEFELGRDLSSARDLLHHALDGLEATPERSRYWRLQQHVRTDGRFRYVTLEVSAACNRTDGLLMLSPADLPLADTSALQNAAAAELAAEAQRSVDRVEQAADLYERAQFFASESEDLSGALAAQEAAQRLRPSVGGLIRLAEAWWSESFSAPETALDRAVANGLAALDRIGSDGLRVAPSQCVESGYMRGLLLARRAATDIKPVPERWAPLPWLLAAALYDAGDPYRAAHLAWGCDTAALSGPACTLAARALAEAEADPWLQETYVVMRMNWYGVLDERSEQVIDSVGDPSWAATVRAADALHRGDHARLRELLADQMSPDSRWARELVAQCTAIAYGMERARPLYEAVLEEASTEPVRHRMASDCALMLGDPARARRHLAAARETGVLAPPELRRGEVIVDLATGGRAPSDAAVREALATIVRPYMHREWTRGWLPALALAYESAPHAARAFEALRGELLARPEAGPPVSMTVDIDVGRETSTVPDLDGLVRLLLGLVDEGEPAAHGGQGVLRQAIADAPPDLRPVLAAALHT